MGYTTPWVAIVVQSDTPTGDLRDPIVGDRNTLDEFVGHSTRTGPKEESVSRRPVGASMISLKSTGFSGLDLPPSGDISRCLVPPPSISGVST